MQKSKALSTSPTRGSSFFLGKDCLGCAVLLCSVVCLILLASFFLPSHLLLKHVYISSLYNYKYLNISHLEHASTDVLVSKISLQVSMRVFDQPIFLARERAQRNLRFPPEHGRLLRPYRLSLNGYVHREKVLLPLTLGSSQPIEVGEQTEELAALALEEVDFEEEGEDKVLVRSLCLGEGTEKCETEEAADLQTSQYHFSLDVLTEKLSGRER